jgi:hypothetical protein
LEQYRTVQFADMTEDAKHIKEIDTNFILKTLDHIKVYETGKIVIYFMDRTEIECDSKSVVFTKLKVVSNKINNYIDNYLY